MTIAEPPPFVLDPMAEPPFAKCRQLVSSHTTFRKSLEGITDESPGEREKSLAFITVMEGWTDQEIVNLLVADRRAKGADLMEDDYYARIIVQARGPIVQARAQARFEANDGGNRAEKLADICTMIGLGPDDPQILDFVKYAGDPPEYWMDTSGGSYTLGRVNNIINQARFIEAVAAVTGIVFVRIPAPAWAKRAEAILSCCREVELGDASHPAVEMVNHVETYLETQAIQNDPDVAAQHGWPFWKDGAILFALDGFRQYVRVVVGDELSTHKLGALLRRGGVTPTHVNYDLVKGGRSTRNYWIHSTPAFSPSDGYKTSVIR